MHLLPDAPDSNTDKHVIILQNSYSWSMIKISLLGYIMDIYVCVYMYV